MVEGVEVVVVGNVVRDDLGVHQVALALLAHLVQRLRGRRKLETRKLEMRKWLRCQEVMI